MALKLESSLSSYAQAAGISQKELNNPKNAQQDADKILAAVASSPSTTDAVIKAALVLDAEQYADGKSTAKDTFGDFRTHVGELTSNSAVSADLEALATPGAVGDNTTMAAFAAVLAKTYHSATGGAGGQGVLQPMSLGHGRNMKGDYDTVSTAVGGYQIQFTQQNRGANSLEIKDPNGNDVTLPSSMSGGNAPGTYTFNGISVTVSGTGKNVSFTVKDALGDSQTADFHGAGGKGSRSLESYVSSGQQATTGSGLSGQSGQSGGSTSDGNNIVYNPETDLSPLWVGNEETKLANEYAQKYGVDPSVFEAGASDEWSSNNGAAGAQLSGYSTASGIQGEVYRAGEQFAAAYRGGGYSTTPSVTPSFTPLATPTSTGTGNTDPSGSGNSASPSTGSGPQLMAPGTLATLEAQVTSSMTSNQAAIFEAATSDVWGQTNYPQSYTLSAAGQAYQNGQLTGQALQYYKAGMAFAKKYTSAGYSGS